MFWSQILASAIEFRPRRGEGRTLLVLSGENACVTHYTLHPALYILFCKLWNEQCTPEQPDSYTAVLRILFRASPYVWSTMNLYTNFFLLHDYQPYLRAHFSIIEYYYRLSLSGIPKSVLDETGSNFVAQCSWIAQLHFSFTMSWHNLAIPTHLLTKQMPKPFHIWLPHSHLPPNNNAFARIIFTSSLHSCTLPAYHFC